MSLTTESLAVTVLVLLCSLLVCAQAAGLVWFSRDIRTRWSCLHEQGDDYLLDPPRNTCGDTRGRPGRRAFHRARTIARRGWKYLQGPGLESPSRHAIRV